MDIIRLLQTFIIIEEKRILYKEKNLANNMKQIMDQAAGSQYIPVCKPTQVTKAFPLHKQQSLKQAPQHLNNMKQQELVGIHLSDTWATKQWEGGEYVPLFKRTGIPCLRRNGSISWVNWSNGPSLSSTWNI